MDKFEELLTKLKELKIIQTDGDWAENLPEEIWEQYFEGNFKEVKYGLYIDTHRWFETSVTVIEIYGRFLGINHITNIFSESQGYEDCYHKMKFMEMKEVKIISYEKV